MSSSVATATHTPLSSSHSRIQQGRKRRRTAEDATVPPSPPKLPCNEVTPTSVLRVSIC
jgi:hypothetical protein